MQTVKLMANYIASLRLEQGNKNEIVYDLLCRYHAYRATEEAKQYCVETIISHMFFLLPHILSSKKIPPEHFDDALQNMTITLMKAIDKYDIRRGSKFTAYLVGYFKDALSITFRDTQVVKNPVYSKYKTPIPIQTNEETSTLDAMCHAITLKNQSDALSPVSSEQNIINKEVVNFLEFAISKGTGVLTDKEIFVITYRYGIFGAPVATLDQIAKMFTAVGWNGTKVWVFQIQQNALKKLRQFFTTNRVTV